MSASRTEERLARVALSHLVEPGDLRVTSLLHQLGPEELLDHLRSDVSRQGVAAEASTRLKGLDPEAALTSAERLGIRFVMPGDSEWPPGFDDLAFCEPLNGKGGEPIGVWVRGARPLNELVGSAVAVVGARSATTYGAAAAYSISAEVVQSGATIVSGAAYGIDQAAHRGAIGGGGTTVAVLACGADRHYPSAHRDLIELTAESGAVVSEVPPGWSPTKLRFLSRNRLIAAMSVGTVVVEAAYRSGALNTANWAGRLGRVLMGVPGPVTSAQSEGVHELVRAGQAMLVTSGADVVEALAPVGEVVREMPRGAGRPEDLLTDGDRRVLEALPVVRGVGVDALARTAGMPSPVVDASLQRLALAGLAETDGHMWRLGRAS